ncbi:MAG: SAM-dependent methyltransferase [Parachlamydiaceae bacterium]
MIHSLFASFKEHMILLWVHLKVKLINLTDYLRVIIRYYPNRRFAKIDSALLYSYLFVNPYRESKRYLVKKGEDEIHTYGETPLTTLELIAGKCEIQSTDVVFELGCGRGRTCFWLHEFIGCSVIGVDYVPIFIQKGYAIKTRFHLQNVHFRLQDLIQVNFSEATVIYLYGTCLSPPYICLLIDRLSRLPRGTKIITVSYSLKEFQPKAPFRIMKRFPARFTWGEAEVYYQIKV